MTEYRVLVAHEGFYPGQIVVSETVRTENLAKSGYLRKVEVVTNGSAIVPDNPGAVGSPRPRAEEVTDVEGRPEPRKRAAGSPVGRSKSRPARREPDSVRVEEDGPEEPGAPVRVEDPEAGPEAV